MDQKGEMLVENIIFIVLNFIFFSILIFFLFSRMGDVAPIEERYAKQIALAVDAAKPGMNITLNMKKAVDNAEGWTGKIVSIQDNLVIVKLREKGGYSYSFFNNVDLSKIYFYAIDGENYIFYVEGYK